MNSPFALIAAAMLAATAFSPVGPTGKPTSVQAEFATSAGPDASLARWGTGETR